MLPQKVTSTFTRASAHTCASTHIRTCICAYTTIHIYMAKKKKETYGVWGNNSIGKAPAIRCENLNQISSTHVKNLGPTSLDPAVYICNPSTGGPAETGIPEANWPVTRAKLMSSGFRKDPISKIRWSMVEEDSQCQPVASTLTSTWVHEHLHNVCTGSGKWIHSPHTTVGGGREELVQVLMSPPHSY